MQQLPSLSGMRLLMTVDAVGGVWRYAMDLAEGLRNAGVETLFVCLGPAPSVDKIEEAKRIGDYCHLGAPLDWLAADQGELDKVPGLIAELARAERVDVLHLNLPSQAAELETDIPVLTVSHSCVVTWFASVRHQRVPDEWRWQQDINRAGFDRSDVVISPSSSHAAMLRSAYGHISNLRVVHNGSRLKNVLAEKRDMVFAAGRWWDEGKNGRVLDEAAGLVSWPVVMAGSNEGPNGQQVPVNHAQHPGELSHMQTVCLMREAKIVASPSVYEPFGLAPLEAARAGTALVLSDIPTYRELWEGCACFADPHNPQAFALQINRLSEDADLRATLAVKAYERSLQFTVQAQTQAMAAIYAGLCSRHHTLTAAE